MLTRVTRSRWSPCLLASAAVLLAAGCSSAECEPPRGADVFFESLGRGRILSASYYNEYSGPLTIAAESDLSPELEAVVDTSPLRGIDYSQWRVRLTFVSYNPDPGTIEWARATDEGIVLFHRVPKYCGGAPPPDSLLLTKLPAGSLPISEFRCPPEECTGPDQP